MKFFIPCKAWIQSPPYISILTIFGVKEAPELLKHQSWKRFLMLFWKLESPKPPFPCMTTLYICFDYCVTNLVHWTRPSLHPLMSLLIPPPVTFPIQTYLRHRIALFFHPDLVAKVFPTEAQVPDIVPTMFVWKTRHYNCNTIDNNYYWFYHTIVKL